MMLITTLVISFLVCCRLEVRCGWAGAVSGLQAKARACNPDTTFSSSSSERKIDGYLQVPAALRYRMNTFNKSMTNGAQRSSRCGGKEKHQNTFRAILQLTDMSGMCYSFSLFKEKFLVKNE